MISSYGLASNIKPYLDGLRIVFDVRDLLQSCGGKKKRQLFFFSLSLLFASVHEWISDK